MTVDNPLIIVHGDTATSQVISPNTGRKRWGSAEEDDAGKEYATWVKLKGQWLYKTRQIASGSNPPEGWKD